MNHHFPMPDKSMDGALLALRAQIIRGKGDGLDHVEALLRLGGLDLPEIRAARRACICGKRGEAPTDRLNALRDGPKTLRDIAAALADKPQIGMGATLQRSGQAFWQLLKSGVVVNDGRV